MLRHYSIILLIGLTFFASAAIASDPSGNWSSSTGSRVHIQAELNGILVTVSTNKGTWRYQGQWTNMPWSFQYFVPNNGTYYAAYDGNNMNRIRVNCPDGSVTVWTRGGSYQQPAQQSFSIDGVWASSSGNTFQLTSKGNQIFVSVVDVNGKRSSGLGRWIRRGQSFDYTMTGFTTPVSAFVVNQNKIKVNNNGAITYWERVQ